MTGPKGLWLLYLYPYRFATMDATMARNSHDIEHNRRGFLRAFLVDSVPKRAEDLAEKALLSKRASILALKHGKNEAKWTKIGVKEPLWVQDSLYRVQIFGHDGLDKRCLRTLEIDVASGAIRHLENSTSTPQENPLS